MKPRFTPIVERPVRTVTAYRARKESRQRADTEASLRAYVARLAREVQEQKGQSNVSTRD